MPPLFYNLSLGRKRRGRGGGGYTWDVTISLGITPSLQVKHDLIVGGRWGRRARQKDAHDASSRLMSFSLERQGSRALPRTSWCPSLMRVVRVHGRHANGRQPSGLNKLIFDCGMSLLLGGTGGLCVG